MEEVYSRDIVHVRILLHMQIMVFNCGFKNATWRTAGRFRTRNNWACAHWSSFMPLALVDSQRRGVSICVAKLRTAFLLDGCRNATTERKAYKLRAITLDGLAPSDDPIGQCHDKHGYPGVVVRQFRSVALDDS